MSGSGDGGALPPGWTTTVLGVIADCRLGKMLDQAKNRGELRPYLRNTNVQWGRISLDDVKEMRIAADERDRYRVLRGDLLVCEGGAPGRCAVWDDGREMYVQKALHRVRPRGGTSPHYLRWWLQRAAVTGGLDHLLTGSTIKHLPGRQLARIDVALPPVVEQHRIAKRLDEVDAASAAAVAHLQAANRAVERFRSAVRTAACAGLLTTALRQSDELTEWETVRLDDVCTSITDGDHQAPPKVSSGIPFITISAMNDARLHLEQATRFVPESYYDALKSTRRPQQGDVLFSVTGSLGIPAIVDTSEPFTFQRHIAILRPDRSRVLTKYLYYALGTDEVRRQGRAVATGTAQLTIPLGGLRGFRIPLPPVEEQVEVVRRVDAMLATADRLATQIEHAGNTLDSAWRGSLTRAFRGELVPTEAALAEEEGRDFESASQLVARIATTARATASTS